MLTKLPRKTLHLSSNNETIISDQAATCMSTRQSIVYFSSSQPSTSSKDVITRQITATALQVMIKGNAVLWFMDAVEHDPFCDSLVIHPQALLILTASLHEQNYNDYYEHIT